MGKKNQQVTNKRRNLQKRNFKYLISNGSPFSFVANISNPGINQTSDKESTTEIKSTIYDSAVHLRVT